MTDPYRLLEVAEDADDDAIQQAYLRMVKTFPPERAPQRFQAIRQAYETLRGPRERLALRWFPTGDPPPLSDLLDSADPAQAGRPTLDELQAALDWSLHQPRRKPDHG